MGTFYKFVEKVRLIFSNAPSIASESDESESNGMQYLRDTTTYFKQYHIYNLVKPLAPNSPIHHVLIVTSDEFLYRRHQQMVTVLLLSPTPREMESEIRVKLDIKNIVGLSGSFSDYWIVVDQLLPMPKSNLILGSGLELSEISKREIANKLANWLGL